MVRSPLTPMPTDRLSAPAASPLTTVRELSASPTILQLPRTKSPQLWFSAPVVLPDTILFSPFSTMVTSIMLSSGAPIAMAQEVSARLSPDWSSVKLSSVSVHVPASHVQPSPAFFSELVETSTKSLSRVVFAAPTLSANAAHRETSRLSASSRLGIFLCFIFLLHKNKKVRGQSHA